VVEVADLAHWDERQGVLLDIFIIIVWPVVTQMTAHAVGALRNHRKDLDNAVRLSGATSIGWSVAGSSALVSGDGILLYPAVAMWGLWTVATIITAMVSVWQNRGRFI